jgi:hypothetical protein
MLWRLLASAFVVGALAATLSACGSSSGSTSTTERASAGTTTTEHAESTPTTSVGGVEESGEADSLEAELAEIMLVKIHGKLGGSGSQFELESGGRCKIVKINTTPASVKADGEAILSPEKNASVEVAPLKGATAAECRKAAEFAIG